MSPEERAKKVAESIANIGKRDYRQTMPLHQPPRLSEHDAEVQHQQAQAQRLK